MKFNLDSKDQDIIITLLLARMKEIREELKGLSHEELKEARLKKEFKQNLDTLDKFKVSQ